LIENQTFLRLCYAKQNVRKILDTTEIGGLRAILVHAKDDQAKAFYQKFDFEASPTHDRHLLLLMKDLRRQLV
jgi:hypothetical protein